MNLNLEFWTNNKKGREYTVVELVICSQTAYICLFVDGIQCIVYDFSRKLIETIYRYLSICFIAMWWVLCYFCMFSNLMNQHHHQLSIELIIFLFCCCSLYRCCAMRRPSECPNHNGIRSIQNDIAQFMDIFVYQQHGKIRLYSHPYAICRIIGFVEKYVHWLQNGIAIPAIVPQPYERSPSPLALLAMLHWMR